MLGANIGQDVGRTIFVKDFYFNAVSLDIYNLLYQTYQSSKWWMCLWWSQSNLSFCSHQIYICFGWSIMGDYYWVCLPGKTWLLWSNEKNLLPNPLWGMWHFSDPSLRWALAQGAAAMYVHYSYIRGLRSIKCSNETLQNLQYFMYKRTHL